VLIAGGWQPDPRLDVALADRGVEVHSLGDCREVRLVEGAMAEAGRLARAL
jgi:hypothetical protein